MRDNKKTMYFNVFNEFMYIAVLCTIVFNFPFLRKAFVPEPVLREEPFSLRRDKNNKIILFDILRGVAILGVILIHVTYLFPFEELHVKELALHALDASMRFALPIFYITSGLLLRSPTKGVKGYFGFLWGRMVKILPAYILVNAVLAFVYSMPLSEFGHNLITGGGAVPFYFIIILFQLYLIYPFVEHLAQKRRFVFGVFWFSLLFFFLSETWRIFEVPTAFRFLFFFVWGIYMRDQLLLGRLKRNILPWLIIFAFCVLVYVLLPGQYYNTRLFYGPAMMMLLIYFLTSNTIFISSSLSKLLAWVGSMSFWIFLTHFTLMEFLLPILWIKAYTTGYIAVFLSAILSIIISVLFGWLCTEIYNSAVSVFNGRLRK